MNYINRTLGKQLEMAVRNFPAVILTGPRRAGKTTLLRHGFADAEYVLLEDPDTVARVTADPRGFLDDITPPVILDEIQNVPQLLNYIRSRIDAAPECFGQWLLTGSQEAPLMQGVTESMAGRAAVFHLLPLSVEESARVSPVHGGFPEPLARREAADLWFRSYVQTYLERDVRAVSSIRDLATFRRFMGLVVSRCGQLLNKTDLAAPLGVSVPTITQWLSILEITGHILLIPPFYENFGKRQVKSPKLYLADAGLACHLLGIPNEKTLRTSPFLGPVFEGFVASEIIKHHLNRGQARGLYTFRDQQGLEVDFVVDDGNGRLTLIEAKATRTPMPDAAASLKRLAKAIAKHETAAWLVHAGQGDQARPRSLCPSVRAVGWENLHEALFAA